MRRVLGSRDIFSFEYVLEVMGDYTDTSILGNRYSTGQKRCQICEIFIKWDGLWCPCCSYMLRMRPRNLKSESKLRARKKIAEYQLLLQQQKKTMKVDV